MPYRVILKRSAEKELDALPASVRERIAVRLLSLEDNPRPPGVKKLQGEESYRLRVGDYALSTLNIRVDVPRQACYNVIHTTANERSRRPTPPASEGHRLKALAGTRRRTSLGSRLTEKTFQVMETRKV